MKRIRTFAWTLLVVPAIWGCGKSEVRVPVVPVTGKLTVRGEIPVGAQVVLHATGHTLPEGVSPVGRVGEDGTFTVSIYGAGEGVPAGDYVATVEWFKVVKSPEGDVISGPNVVPPKYGNPATSPLKVTVKPEPTALEPIIIR
ncbi:MAG: hypothetical protein HYX69_20355 [Planctomycetia bacterium]|nr:hypothetical protein [Planctomycetia bacterium]